MSLTYKVPAITRECFPNLPEFLVSEWVKTALWNAAWIAACFAVCAFGYLVRF